MNNQGKSLLILKTEDHLDADTVQRITMAMEPLCEEIGSKILILDGDMDGALHQNIGPLLTMIGKQVDAINNLAASNMALVEQMAQQDEEPDPDAIPEAMSRKR